MTKSFLFISGVPRSGTTTITELFGSHRLAAIGIERYKKFLAVRSQHLLTPALFEKERFFEFGEDETNIRPDGRYSDHYDAVRERFDSARVLGDKIPTYYYMYHHLLRVFPNAKLICIVRDPYEVASSWNRRAKNPADRWGEDQDAKRSVLRWTECLELCTRARAEYPESFLIVEHARLFGGDETLYRELSDAVGLSADATDLQRFADTCTAWSKVKGKPLDLDESEIREITKRADFDRYEKLTGTRLQPRAVATAAK